MQSNYIQPLTQDNWIYTPEDPSLQVAASTVEDQDAVTHFKSHFVGCMSLKGDADAVTEYLNAHQGWFCRCAQPMAATPVGESGYLLTIGKHGSFGFDVEPKIGLHLLPSDAQGVYRIETIDHPEVDTSLYQVDFKAALQLLEDSSEPQPAEPDAQAAVVTRVEWTLDLGVNIRFPRFIQRLPKSIVQGTGDRLLRQIVRQVSRRLTAKVQDDFHSRLA